MNPLAARFLQPANPTHRQYEALRAHFVDGLPPAEAAARFGYSRGSFHNLLSAFRRQPDRSFFAVSPPGQRPLQAQETPPADDRTSRVLALRQEENLSVSDIERRLRREGCPLSAKTIQRLLREAGLGKLPRRSAEERHLAARPDLAAQADRRQLDLRPRSFRTAFGGLFLFAPALARLPFPQLLAECGLPGSVQIPAASACLALLALKLWGLGRPSHAMTEVFDEGLALFAALNTFPKRSTLTEYTCRIDPRCLAPLQRRWSEALGQPTLPWGSSFDLDFHTIPYHGDDALIQKHSVSKRSRRQKGILAFLARGVDARVFRYAEATVREETRAEAPLRFADFCRERTGAYPEELVFDSTLTTRAVLAQLDQLGIGFLTLRRRSPQLIQAVRAAPAAQWRRVELHNVGRRYRHPRALDQTVQLRGYPGPIRQIAVLDLGHEDPVLLVTNRLREPVGQVVDRYARRMVIENAIADAIDFFHMDALSSAVPMKIDADLQLTLMASSLYRQLGVRVGQGYERAQPRTLFRHFVQTAATLEVQERALVVRLGRRVHNPLLIAAGYGEDSVPLPWLGGRQLRLTFG